MEVLSIDADRSRTTLYLRGFNDGVAARGRAYYLTPYLRVGIDDYAQGYRSGFYSRKVSLSDESRKAHDGG